VSLTEAGGGLVAGSRRLLQLAGDLHDNARVPRDALCGRVALGCFPTLTPLYVSLLFQVLEQEHPGAHLEVTEGSQDGLTSAAVSGACDVVLTYARALRMSFSRGSWTWPSRTCCCRLITGWVRGTALNCGIWLMSADPFRAGPRSRQRGSAAARGGRDTADRTPIRQHRDGSLHGGARAQMDILVQQWPASVRMEGLRLLQRPLSPTAPT
jgi:hypothetical protein